MFTQMGLDDMWKFALSREGMPSNYLCIVCDNENYQCMRVFSTYESLYLFFLRLTPLQDLEIENTRWVKLTDLSTFPEITVQIMQA